MAKVDAQSSESFDVSAVGSLDTLTQVDALQFVKMIQNDDVAALEKLYEGNVFRNLLTVVEKSGWKPEDVAEDVGKPMWSEEIIDQFANFTELKGKRLVMLAVLIVDDETLYKKAREVIVTHDQLVKAVPLSGRK